MFKNSVVTLAKAANTASTANNTGKFHKQLNQVQNLLGVAKRRTKNINQSFSKEDYLKHRLIERYRTLYLNKQHLQRQANLERQFESMNEAMSLLQKILLNTMSLLKIDKTRRIPC
ncbi:hypothetical protein HANVADRAFT_120645 [Hanseniaspora valbyensis NRRL Y-1626]|uniref:Uncharacterized protein n=1 Tax=Hanseniaspora valbyensis NRRL Y-1626 TaxID=766949 RepID=A0A1B7T7U0_9ASCO|nr:hypothetical protein HANVADRAFT_120645 [Hanseniaspora valbyensis NRRL Y-1626]